jgi:adenine-specific DNA-methyltransferase
MLRIAATDDTITARADKVRREVSPRLVVERRAKLGQFMTPQAVAADMAAMFDVLPADVRLLDAGAGIGALTAAFVADALSRPTPPCSIAVTAFEVDHDLAELLRYTLEDCREACVAKGVIFRADIIEDDYILRSAEPLLALGGRFNCAILNPPYAKLNTGSRWRLALRSVGIETVNLYPAFVALAVDQLDEGGQLVAITPRSFCNGPYYEPFRRHILTRAGLLRLHVFESRKKAFKDDAVLQENVIFQLRKGGEQDATVRLETDGGNARDVPFEEVVRPGDPHRFIRLTISAEDAALAERVQALPCRLADLGIKVSTGRVVDFRAREHLRKDAGLDTVPLIYPAHLRDGGVRWPIDGLKKHNALARCERTEDLLIPAGRYVLTKRFSAKEERRRLVASLYDAGGAVGLENHLNYFHDGGQGLPKDLAAGLSAFLNSTAVDDYFRQFSGHTQVNATDLRNLHYPSREQLEQLGQTCPAGQAAIDDAVEAILPLPSPE